MMIPEVTHLSAAAQRDRQGEDCHIKTDVTQQIHKYRQFNFTSPFRSQWSPHLCLSLAGPKGHNSRPPLTPKHTAGDTAKKLRSFIHHTVSVK